MKREYRRRNKAAGDYDYRGGWPASAAASRFKNKDSTSTQTGDE